MLSVVVKRLMPVRLKRAIKDFFIKQSCRGTLFHCPVCESGLNHFNRMHDYFLRELQDHQYIHSISAEETLNILNFECPFCGAYDRDRLFALYYKALFPNLDQSRKYRFIDFAPSDCLSPFLKNQSFLSYRSADLVDPRADDKVDLTDMKIYGDESVDLFLCSHILEHVPDDRKGMRELHRILHPKGQGIVMVPILLSLTDVYENSEMCSKSERWRHFGQDDHVRIYSKCGFVGRLEEAGFHVNQFGVGYFGEQIFEKHGIHPRSVLYVVNKAN
jgi:SAM-dependent methyltransferase